MKPSPLVYVRPKTVTEAVGLLSEVEWGARVIAGGQSLVPMLNLRLAPLIKLVDISRIEELRTAQDDGDSVTYGACLRHGEFEDATVPDATNGFMQRVASRIAYRAIRNRGTIGGSVCLADPSADWIAALMALDAEYRIVGPDGTHSVETADMFIGPYTTAIGDHDILSAITVRKLSSRARTGYYKIIRKAGEYPMTTAAVVRDPNLGLSNIVLGVANRPQIRLAASSNLLKQDPQWSESTRGAFLAAFHQDMAGADRAGDPEELKLSETTVLRAVQRALE